jgi:hypothetical protein
MNIPGHQAKHVIISDATREGYGDCGGRFILQSITLRKEFANLVGSDSSKTSRYHLILTVEDQSDGQASS